MAKGLCYEPRGPIGRKADESVPPGVDHDNPSTKSFVNDTNAGAMLSRNYRHPFVVPARV